MLKLLVYLMFFPIIIAFKKLKSSILSTNITNDLLVKVKILSSVRDSHHKKHFCPLSCLTYISFLCDISL